MFEVKFEPTACKPKLDEKGEIVAPAKFSGTVTVRMPTFVERQELVNHGGMLDEQIVEIARQVALDGAVIDEDAMKEKISQQVVKQRMSLLMRVCGCLGKFTTAVELTRLEDGYAFTKLDELMHDSDTEGVIVEMASKVISKFHVGKTNSAK